VEAVTARDDGRPEARVVGDKADGGRGTGAVVSTEQEFVAERASFLWLILLLEQLKTITLIREPPRRCTLTGQVPRHILNAKPVELQSKKLHSLLLRVSFGSSCKNIGSGGTPSHGNDLHAQTAARRRIYTAMRGRQRH
jgi:hypothetical protein